MNERERRAFNRGVEAAAKIADLWADENCRMFQHTLLADPVLNGELKIKPGPAQPHELPRIEEAFKTSERLGEEGHEASIRHHAAKDIAAMIREQKKKR